MMSASSAARRLRSRGQALAEMALVVLMLVALAAGVVEFGRAFMLVNLITHATHEGARFAAALPDTFREASGCYTAAGRTAVTDHVADLIQDLMNASGSVDDIAVTQVLDAAMPTVTVRITGSVDFIMLPGLVGSSFDVDRTMTFRDEGRGEGVTC